MPTESVKIFEVSGDDWMKGIALHPTIPMGGLFKAATAFYPFRKMGEHVGELESSSVASAIAHDMSYRVKVDVSGSGYILYFGYDSGAYAYQVAESGYATTDKTAQIGYGKTLDQMRGAGVFKNKVVYSTDTYIYSNSKSLTLANEVTTVSSGLVSGKERIFKIGPDRNCYFTNGQYVGRLTSVTGTTGNSATYLTFEDDVITRDLESDSQHLVVAGDNNPTGSPLDYRCFVGWWNMKSNDLTRVWEFTDSKIYAIKRLGNSESFLVFGNRGVYITSIGQYPTLIVPRGGNFVSVPVPPGPHGVDIKDGCVLWVSGATGQEVWGYGAPVEGMKKVLFQYTGTGTDAGLTLAVTSGGAVLAGHNNTPTRKGLTTAGAAAQQATITLSDILLPKPYSFSFARIILADDLASGQSVDLSITNDPTPAGVLTQQTRSFTNDGSRSVLMYFPTADTSTLPVFDYLGSISINNTGARIKKLEIWGKPEEEDMGML